MHFRWIRDKISNWLIEIYAEIIFLHISNGSEIPLISILKSFVDTLVSFLKWEVIIISLLIENIVVSDLSMTIQTRAANCRKIRPSHPKL